MDITMASPTNVSTAPLTPVTGDSAIHQQRKRLRFSGNNEVVLIPSPASPDPKMSTHDVMMSLPQALRPLAQHYATKFKKLSHRKKELLNKKIKLTAREFIPNSLRVSFELGATDAVKEAHKELYDTACLECAVALDTYQTSIMNVMCEVLTLEIRVVNLEINEVFCDAITTMAKAFAILNQLDVSKAPYLVFHTFDHYDAALLKYTSMSNDTFFEKYHLTNAISESRYISGSISEENAHPVRHLSFAFYTCLMSLLVCPIDVMHKQSEDLSVLGKLREFAQLKLKDTATKQTAMDLEDTTDGSLTKQTILDLIRTEVKLKQGKALRSAQTGNTLKTKTKSSNHANKDAAKTTQCKNNQQKQKKKQGKNGKNGADGAANVSSKKKNHANQEKKRNTNINNSQRSRRQTRKSTQ